MAPLEQVKAGHINIFTAIDMQNKLTDTLRQAERLKAKKKYYKE